MNLPFGISMETDFNGNGYLFLGLLLMGLIFIFLMNRPRRNSQSPREYWLNWLIPIVRSAALIILLILLFSPELSLSRKYSIPKRLAVVIDESSSMGKAWEGDIEALENSILKVIGKLEENHSVDIWTMDGQSLVSDKLSFEKNLSVFDWNPLSINGEDNSDIYSSMFLFSDGHLNGGRSPLDLAWSKSLEINVVYPLIPRSNAFLKLINLNYVADEKKPEQIQITGRLHQEGLFGRNANIQILTEMEQLLGEEHLQLKQGFQEMSVPIRIKDDVAQRIKVKLSLDGGEFLTEQFLVINQRKAQPSVLIVSERINELHKFLVQSFSDSSYQVYVVHGTMRADANPKQEIIPDKVDLIILNHPGDQALQAISRTTFNLKAQLKTPTVLFYDGVEKLDPQWVKNLDIQGIHTNSMAGSQTCFWSENAKDHPFYLGLLGRGYAHRDLMDYAPVDVPGYRLVRGGVDLLMTGYGAATRPVLSLSDHPPRAIFSGNGFWRWFFHPQSRTSFEKLWNYLLTYLEEIASFTPVQIALPMESAATGSYIVADVSIKDLDNRSIKAAELRVWQEDEMGDKSQLNLSRNEGGNYQAQLDTKVAGEKLIIAEAYRFGELWGRDTSRIHLMNFNGEDQSRGVNEIFLSRLASHSGGRLIQLQEEDLPMVPVESVERESSFHFTGVRSPLLFSMLLILLTFEWIWRRRSGLL
ncbi:MAG: hypothetical protein K9N29_06370 [Candidatus Marinimicrobia bacterium]|nr:hypothetical protein [Candidatus Neomarinimicrobiota bacterium]